MRSSNFQLEEEYTMGRDYGRTLKLWHERFVDNLDAVRAQGFDDEFIRKWIYYLCYCEAGFNTGLIDVRQFILAR